MQKLQNNTLQKFLDNVITELKRSNDDRQLYDIDIQEFDIPFIISSLWQSFNNNPDKYIEFISDLEKWSDYNVNIDESRNDYNGIIDVTVVLVDINNSEDLDILYSDYHYRFEFSYDTRDYGYCECTPDMPDYREDKHCCGHGCDWEAPSVEVRKSFLVSNHSWHGDEHDYWDFEDKFYADDKEENEKKLLAERECKIRNLKETIENAQKELKKLENL